LAIVFNLISHYRIAALTSLMVLLIVSTVSSATLPVIQNSAEAAAHLKRGKLLFYKNDFAGAIENYNKAIELRPNWAEAYLQRGMARRMHGQLDGSIADYDKASELDPQTTKNNRSVAQAYTNHGQILATNSQLENAITDFNKALKLYAADVRPYYERAQARLLLEDFNNALADYDTYLNQEKYDPFNRARAYLERGLTKHLLGRDEEANKDAAEGLKLAGQYAKDLMLALAYLEQRIKILHQIRAQQHKAIG
jgi:tetratricopeptide (TPR) repeat protein